jgi:gas vesicle protein
MNAGKVLLSLLAALSVGALVGVLLAPEKGTKTRRKISDNSHDMINNLTTKFDELVDSLSQKASNVKEDVKEDVKDVSNKVKSKFDHISS